jgi:SAM-dependent methyltransferase
LPNKRRFLIRIIKHRLHGQQCVCPFCQESNALTLLKRKGFVLDILRCETCKLIFRWPADSEDESYAYYERFYSESHPQVRLPSAAELSEMLHKHFSETPLDLGSKIALLKTMRPNCRILDYGCSWGYGTHQFVRQGFDAVGFEISQRRAIYGREKLGLKIVTDFDKLKSMPEKSFDVIFSHHVLEHLQGIRSAFEVMSHLLADDGFLYHVLPNFTGRLARTGMWLKWIGEEHPLAPTIDFFRHALPQFGFGRICFGSSPFGEELAAALRNSHWESTQTEGDELLCLASRKD